MDEGCLTIQGKTAYLWRAVDPHENVLDILVQSRRNTGAAKTLFRNRLKGCRYVPRVLITGYPGEVKLATYGAAQREMRRAWNTGSTRA